MRFTAEGKLLYLYDKNTNFLKFDYDKDSTVREVMGLRKKNRAGKKREKEYPTAITLSFKKYIDAAEALKELVLSEKHDFKIKAHQALADALKAVIQDNEQYEKAVAKRLA